jgi:hypothetical protein
LGESTDEATETQYERELRCVEGAFFGVAMVPSGGEFEGELSATVSLSALAGSSSGSSWGNLPKKVAKGIKLGQKAKGGLGEGKAGKAKPSPKNE